MLVWVKHDRLGAVQIEQEQIDHLRAHGVPVEVCSDPVWTAHVNVQEVVAQVATYVPATEAPAKKRRGRPRKVRE